MMHLNFPLTNTNLVYFYSQLLHSHDEFDSITEFGSPIRSGCTCYGLRPNQSSTSTLLYSTDYSYMLQLAQYSIDWYALP